MPIDQLITLTLTYCCSIYQLKISGFAENLSNLFVVRHTYMNVTN